jgi:aspartyl/asparaginyl beta-hydroxylase (cupin superfamily)
MDFADAHRMVNSWFLKTAGGDGRPAFHDIDAVCPALRRIDRAFPEIRAEVLGILDRRHELPLLHETDPGQECISDATPEDWRVLYLSLMGARADANRARCPVTSAAVDRVPGVFQSCFSILDPGKSVPPHAGPYFGYLRYHLALVVPDQDPPQLKVNGEPYTWREGESILFDDTHTHEVINTSAEPRVVLIVDVFRPMPLAQTLVNRGARRLAARVYGRPTLQRALEHVSDQPGRLAP